MTTYPSARLQGSTRVTPRPQPAHHELGTVDPLTRATPRGNRAGIAPVVLADATALALAGLLHGTVDAFVLLLAVGTVTGLGLARSYRRRLTLSVLTDLPVLLGVGLTATSLAGSVVGLWSSGGPRDLLHLLTLPAALVLARLVAYAVIHRRRRAGLDEGRALVVGGQQAAEELVESLRQDRRFGTRPVGVLTDESEKTLRRAGRHLLAEHRLGRPDHLAQAIVDQQVSDVFLLPTQEDEGSMLALVRYADVLPVRFHVVPQLSQRVSGQLGRGADQVWGIPVLRLRRAAYRRPAWGLKRSFDVVTSATALVLVAPLLALVALAVRLEGGPGVIFRQRRVGLGGHPFTVLKFRSLRPASTLEHQTTWNVSNDDRLGPVGRIIRTYSLDELPQLWNVFRGDMSMVGPRPERPHFVNQFGRTFAEYPSRHRVVPGLTGLAAVNGLRGDTSIEDRARFDNLYIDNWSLWLDCRILLTTVVSVIRGQGG